MSVMFTGDAEKKRTENAQEARKASWEYITTTSMVEAVRYARDHGWKKRKVQVRATRIGGLIEFSVEPYEGECGCPDILKYEDYFD